MKWVIVSKMHINTDQVQQFRWSLGVLLVWFEGKTEPTRWCDPKRELYLKLCWGLGVRPVEEDADGKN